MPDPVSSGIAASTLLAEARVLAGLSQRALAERAGTSQARISRIESGSEDPSYGQLEKLIAACGFELASTVKKPSISPEELRQTTADLARAAALSQFLTRVAIAATKSA
jgi:transcriptional regulator with XRE-family HTH domain